jgi:hypothetical protein
LPLLFNFALEYAIRRVLENQVGLKLSGTHQLLIYADAANILGGTVYTIKQNTQSLVVTSKQVDLQVNAEKISIWSCLKIRIQDKIATYR